MFGTCGAKQTERERERERERGTKRHTLAQYMRTHGQRNLPQTCINFDQRNSVLFYGLSRCPKPVTSNPQREILKKATIPCRIYVVPTGVQETAQLHVTAPPEAESKVTPSLPTPNMNRPRRSNSSASRLEAYKQASMTQCTQTHSAITQEVPTETPSTIPQKLW